MIQKQPWGINKLSTIKKDVGLVFWSSFVWYDAYCIKAWDWLPTACREKVTLYFECCNWFLTCNSRLSLWTTALASSKRIAHMLVQRSSWLVPVAETPNANFTINRSTLQLLSDNKVNSICIRLWCSQSIVCQLQVHRRSRHSRQRPSARMQTIFWRV